jgi:hypothetical protein
MLSSPLDQIKPEYPVATAAEYRRRRPSWLGKLLGGVLTLVIASSCTSDCDCAAESDTATTISEADPVWQQIAGGGETRCALDTPYEFWSRQGDPQKVLLVLEGGGACWNRENCDPKRSPSYDSDVGDDESPGNLAGVFDLEHPGNPVGDYSVVFAPTCTGDVLLGDSVIKYESEDGSDPLVVHHVGYRNTQAVLQWTYEHYPDPETVFVVGWSAGAIPSPMVAAQVAENYPDTRVAHFADGAGMYHVGPALLSPLLESWGTEHVLESRGGYGQVDIGNFSFEDIYVTEALRHPEITLHQYNSHEDEIGRLFLTLLGAPKEATVTEYRERGHQYIRSHIDNFRTYTAGGDHENVMGGYFDGVLSKMNQRHGRPLALDRFYHYRVGDVAFVNWFSDIATARPVDDVACDPCDKPEYVTP